jgi:glycosyltransferase involved in cell wall biosynthesis
MKPEGQLHLADVLRTCRGQLENTLDEIHARDTRLTDLEVKLAKAVVAARLESVEDQLRFDAYHRMHVGRTARLARWTPARLRRFLSRLRGLARPRIGVLRHYPPRPLLVPASYLNEQPPDQPQTISIVTPSFAQGRYLERTLQSVLSQNYPALEYFVQDSCSTDETEEILLRYQGLLTGSVSEPDDGQADAINRGFRRSTGEIMAWLNSDDLLLPGSLAYVARYFANHPEVDVVYGHRLMIDEHDHQIGAWILPSHDDVTLTLADYIPQETLFWRRRIWDLAGGYVDASFGYALDWDLLLRFRDAGAKMVRLPRYLGAFRIHDEQKTTAEHPLGLSETKRLRQRVYGREVPIEEVVMGLRPFLMRHILVHSWQRVVDRLPRKRICLSTMPVTDKADTLRLTPTEAKGNPRHAETSNARASSGSTPAGALESRDAG